MIAEGGQEVPKCGAEASCSPGEAHGGAGHAPAAHGHHMEQISMCSHGGAHRAAVDMKEVQLMESTCRSSTGPELKLLGLWWGGGLGELLLMETCAGVVHF